MKVLLIATLLMSAAFADDAKKDSSAELNIAQIKERVLSNIDEKIKVLQTQKTCIQGVSNKEQLQSCREAHKASMKKMYEKNKGERKEFKAQRDERREKNEKRGRHGRPGNRKGGKPSQNTEE